MVKLLTSRDLALNLSASYGKGRPFIRAQTRMCVGGESEQFSRTSSIC